MAVREQMALGSVHVRASERYGGCTTVHVRQTRCARRLFYKSIVPLLPQYFE